MTGHAYDVQSFTFGAATATLILVYLFIISERVNRAVIAMFGAALLVVMGILNQEQAVRAVDFNTVGLLVGMMIMVAVARKSGLFGYVAVKAAQMAKASPAGILVSLALVTALFSALLNNVTTALLIVPVVFMICGQLKVPVYPYLFAVVFASNIGGTATLVGDPPNIMIGSAAPLGFDAFILNLAPVVAVIMAIMVMQLAINHIIWGRRLHATAQNRLHVMSLDANEQITDRRLLKWSLWLLTLTISGFVVEDYFHLQAATVALMGAAAMLLVENLAYHQHKHMENVTLALGEVEWVTIFFFIGLFIVVGAAEHAGLLSYLADRLVAYTGSDSRLAAIGILWSSAVLSAIIDNIPFVAAMIPLIKNLAPAFGGAAALEPLWWSLALGACLGGNGTLIGASPNLVVAGLAEKAGVRFSFVKYTLYGFPMMLASIAICHFYILWRYF